MKELGGVKSASHYVPLADTLYIEGVISEKHAPISDRKPSAAKEYLKRRWNYDIVTVVESEPFRFGPGPRLLSKFAVLLPVTFPKRCKAKTISRKGHKAFSRSHSAVTM